MSEPTDLAEAEDYLDGSQDPSSKKVPTDHSAVGKREHPVQMELRPLGAISTELTLKSHELGRLLKSHGIGATYLSVAIQCDRREGDVMYASDRRHHGRTAQSASVELVEEACTDLFIGNKAKR